MQTRIVLVAALLIAASTARADDVGTARAEYDRGLSAYALGHYADAADHYEKAFALKPDPALLYNAAQAHRLAGNKQRALLLYTSYLKLFGANVENREEAQRHISELKAAIAAEPQTHVGSATTPAPNATESHAAPPPPPPAPAPVTTPAARPAPATEPLTVTSAPPERPRHSKAWIWGVVGGVVVVGAAIGLGVGLGVHPANPTPSLGVAVLH